MDMDDPLAEALREVPEKAEGAYALAEPAATRARAAENFMLLDGMYRRQ